MGREGLDKVSAEKLPMFNNVKFWKLPNSIMKMWRKMAFSIPKKSVMRTIKLLSLPELLIVAMLVINPNVNFFILLGILVLLVFVTAIFLMVNYYPIIAIRKDCFNCRFNFQVIAHELNHLRLNSSDETTVEETTIKEKRTA